MKKEIQIEKIFKTGLLILFESGSQAPFTHDVYKLFKKLGEENRNRIKRLYEKCVNEKSDIKERISRIKEYEESQGIIDQFDDLNLDIEYILQKFGETFKDDKYTVSDGIVQGKNNAGLPEVVWAVRERIIELIPR